MAQTSYMKRYADQLLANQLDASGAVLVEGPKWCGKTTTSQQIAKSVLNMADPTTLSQNLLLADAQPEVLLQGATPRLIDEWQIAPKLWDSVRFEVDNRRDFNQFILTGSNVPPKLDEISHSGTGRIARIRMRPMSLFESQDSQGVVSLEELFAKNELSATPVEPKTLEEIAFLICRGGWPRSIGQSEAVALLQARNYFDAVTELDITRVDGIDRDPQTAKQLLRSYARMESSEAKISEIAKDLSTRQDDEKSGTPSRVTVLSYLTALERIFVIEDLPAWNPNLRSKTALRTTPTRHFVDPSIASAALGVSPRGLMQDLNTMGLLFEGLCIRDLRIYAEVLDGEIFHYRDSSNLESDAVIHLRDGRFGLIEVKLGGERLINEGAGNLIKLANRLDTSRMGEPSFLMVLTATGNFAYTREDGVMVVPVGALSA